MQQGADDKGGGGGKAQSVQQLDGADKEPSLSEFIEAALGPEYKEDFASVEETLRNKPFRVKSVKALSALSEDAWSRFASEEGEAAAGLLKVKFAPNNQSADASERKLKRQKTLHAIDDDAVKQAKRLHDEIKALVINETNLSDPSTITALQFPFLGEVPSRFNVSSNRQFPFMGRKAFAKLNESVQKLGGVDHDLIMQGTAGFGKSHITAALVCWLIKQGRRVVYLPDCKKMLKDRVKYLREALVLAVHDDQDALQFLFDDLTNEETLIKLCQLRQLVFVVDQLNALDVNLSGDDFKDDKIDCRKLINGASYGKVIIQAASANNQTSKKVGDQQVRQIVLNWFGGFSQDEYEAWCKHNQDRLPKMEKNQQQIMEGATGFIPLFLDALLAPAEEKSGDFDLAYERLLQHPLITQVPVHLDVFTRTVDTRFEDVHFAILQACVLEMTTALFNPSCFDHRYLYRSEDGKMHCVNDLVRGFVTDLLHKHQSSLMLDDTWINSCRHATSNPSVQGFLAENIVIAHIRANGLTVGELFKPGAFRVFAKGTEAVVISNESGALIMYIPDIFNYKAIDLLLRRVPTNKAKAVEIVPIQVTLQKPAEHKKSINDFFGACNVWLGAATKVDWRFVWLTPYAQDPVEHKAADGVPAFTEYFVSFGQACKQLNFLDKKKGAHVLQ